MAELTLVRWVHWTDKKYKDCDESKPVYTDLVCDYIRKHNLRMSGYDHQQNDRGVPVFSDGTALRKSMRGWGAVMAQALELKGEMAYCTFAWGLPENVTKVLP